MKMRHDFAALAALLIRNEGKWMMLDDDGYPNTLSGRAWAWRNRPPKDFEGHDFRFRVRRDKYSNQPSWVLWGIYGEEQDA